MCKVVLVAVVEQLGERNRKNSSYKMDSIKFVSKLNLKQSHRMFIE